MLFPYGQFLWQVAALVVPQEHYLKEQLKKGAFSDPRLLISLGQIVKQNLTAIHLATQYLDVPSVLLQSSRMHKLIDGGKFTAQELLQQVTAMRERIEDELSAHEFYYVRAEDASLYTEPDLFGEEVTKRFPDARDAIEEAGKCLALGRATATVFHLCGVMELGLRALGLALDIPYAPSWEAYIRQVTAKIESPHKTKKKAWKNNETLYRDVLGDLTAAKIAWRNPTIHVRRKYTPEEAHEVFRAARTFMRQLVKLPEPKKRQSVRKA